MCQTVPPQTLNKNCNHWFINNLRLIYTKLDRFTTGLPVLEGCFQVKALFTRCLPGPDGLRPSWAGFWALYPFSWMPQQRSRTEDFVTGDEQSLTPWWVWHLESATLLSSVSPTRLKFSEQVDLESFWASFQDNSFHWLWGLLSWWTLVRWLTAKYGEAKSP